MADFWSEADLIHSYSRAQALADGMLVDVSQLAHEAGFKWPVAITAAVWALVNNIPARSLQDPTGRLWDVLTMAHWAARRPGTETLFELFLQHGRKKKATLKLHAGPGDDGEPVLTIMLPNED